MNNDPKEIIRIYQNTEDCKYKFRLLIIKLYHQNFSGTEIAQILEISKSSVYYWLSIFKKEGIDGLKGKKRSGRPRKVDYKKLQKDLQTLPINLGYNSSKWTVEIIKQHIHDSQGVDISSSHIYAILEEMGLSIKCTGINCLKSRDLKTIRGETITPLHLELMSEASIMLDAPIARIITSQGIKPELKIVSQSKDKIILKGNTETGELTLTYEEFHKPQ